MVWGLIPVDSPRGTQNYYIFSPGTYKIGRKDCDVIVQTDTSISRVHAEIIIEKMISWEPTNTGPTSESHVRIVDRSKYGTFVKGDAGSEATRLKKDDDVGLGDNDLVTFGTGNATFRFTLIPIVAYLYGKKQSRVNHSFQSTISSIGAYITRKWSDDCTHVLVEDHSPLEDEIIDAILARKEIVSKDWFKALAEQNICTDIPSCSSYIPCLMLDNVEIKMVEVKLRENCLEGHTFVLGAWDKYKFGGKLGSLLIVAGAKFHHVDEFCSNNSQKSADIGEQDGAILVIPSKSPLEFNYSKELSSLSKVTDLKLVAAILSGKLERAAVEPPSYIITSSHSTDETIVADSDVEMDTAISVQPKEGTLEATENASNIHIREQEVDVVASRVADSDVEMYTAISVRPNEGPLEVTENASNSNIREQEVDVVASTVLPDVAMNEDVNTKEESVRGMARINKGDNSVMDRDEHSDIIFSQNLIVKRNCQMPPPAASDSTVVNFKRFRKREIKSGNSYHDLVPFAKDPYRESNEEYTGVSEFIQEEKRRKQMEASAEELFNNEKGRKKAYGSTPIYALLSSR